MTAEIIPFPQPAGRDDEPDLAGPEGRARVDASLARRRIIAEAKEVVFHATKLLIMLHDQQNGR
jgi:hypothetical protein